MDILNKLGFVVFLVFLNGYFVASEFALVAVRKTRIDELVRKGNPTARLVQKAQKDLDSYISSTQLGITISSLALGWIGEPAIARVIEPLLSFLPSQIAFISLHAISTFIAFSFITFLHIVLGELAPKTAALQRAESISLIIIVPLVIFTKIFRPIIIVLNGAGNIFLKLIGLSAPSGHQLVHSEEEIRAILNQSVEEGEIERDEAEMVTNVFKLGDIPVKNIMVPRTEIIAFNVNNSIKEVVKKTENKVHSRFPVYEKSIDSIVGFIHIKDIYKTIFKNEDNLKISQTDLIREILIVPETKTADEVLLDMQRKRVHMAVVNDEFGGTAGIVTLEDIIESIVGEIQDEFDKPLKEIEKQKDGSYIINGLTPIETIYSKFKLPIKGQGYATIGGLVFGLLGHEPNQGDVVQIGNFLLEVEKIERKRIKYIKLKNTKKKSHI